MKLYTLVLWYWKKRILRLNESKKESCLDMSWGQTEDILEAGLLWGDRQKKPTDEGDGKHLHSENILSVNKQNHKRLKSQFLPVQGSGWRWPDWTQCCGTEVDSATIARFHRWRWWWDGLDRFPPGCRCHSTDPEKLQQRRGVSHRWRLTWQERSFFIFILQRNGEG